jgi:ABC-2 type transport system permease protein
MATADHAAGGFVVGLRTTLLESLRSPTALGLLVVLPPVVVVAYAEAMASFPALPFVETVPRTAGRLNGALFATAFLAGLLGLFQVVSAARADRRLVVAGYPRLTLFLARLASVLVVVAVAATLSLATLWLGVTPEAPLAAFGALLLAGLTYGLVGVLVGSVLPRELEGSLVLVTLADLDAVLSSGLVEAEGLGSMTPLHAANPLFRAAVLDGTIPADELRAGVTTVVGLAVLAAVAYLRLVGTSGSGSVQSSGGRPAADSGGDRR